MRISLLCITVILQLLLTTATYAKELSITSFNIRWYGTSDKSDPTTSDARDRYIKTFLRQSELNSDAYVFQEIIDLEGLQNSVLQGKYNCITYENNNSNHQHVVVCHKNEYNFIKADDDDNFVLEEVALGNYLRPAIHGILQSKNGVRLAHIIGVHLKAYPDETEIRLRQIKHIASYISHRESNIPYVITGDFNTFNDDAHQMSVSFNRHQAGVDLAESNYENTFRTVRYRGKLDHFWISDSVRIIAGPTVHGPCNNASTSQGSTYKNVVWFNEHVSDHCPVTVTFDTLGIF